MNRRLDFQLLLGACLWLMVDPSVQADDSRLVTEGVVEASVEDVWRGFTTKAGMESWMVALADIDLKLGGKMRTHYDPKGMLGDAKSIEHTILSFEPERMFSMKVTKHPDTFPFPAAIQSVWTVLYFDPTPDKKTRVRIVMLGYGANEESQKMREFFDAGNQYTLKRLQQRFDPANGK
jgi:uncharacterized protein YndB with AHSA1/START domain